MTPAINAVPAKIKSGVIIAIGNCGNHHSDSNRSGTDDGNKRKEKCYHKYRRKKMITYYLNTSGNNKSLNKAGINRGYHC